MPAIRLFHFSFESNIWGSFIPRFRFVEKTILSCYSEIEAECEVAITENRKIFTATINGIFLEKVEMLGELNTVLSFSSLLLVAFPNLWFFEISTCHCNPCSIYTDISI